MCIMNVGSTFVNWDRVVTANIEEEEDGVILRVESDNVADEIFIPDVTVEQTAAAIRHGMRMEAVFDLMYYINKVKIFRGEDND